MNPNGAPPHSPSSGPSTASSVTTHGGNLPTSVLLRMKSQNSNTGSQPSSDAGRRENVTYFFNF